MPEFSVGGGGPGGGGGGVSPVAFASIFPLLPRAYEPDRRGTIENVAMTEVGDQLMGRAGNTAAETKGIQKGIEKGLKFGKLREALLDVFFGDSKVGSPEPPSVPVENQELAEALSPELKRRRQEAEVQMLPMWTADP